MTMTLLDGDRMRLCLHPRVAPHPLPEKLHVIDEQSRVVLRPPATLGRNARITLIRCLECGLVGEPAQ